MRNANGLETLDGMEYLASCPDGEIITGMVAKGDSLYVSTDKHIYKLADERRFEKLTDDNSWGA